MRGFGLLKRAGALLAGVAVLPGMAWAQSNGTAPQVIPGGGFNLPPKPTPTPAPPPSGPVIAPFARPTPAPAPAPTPVPSPAATVTPPPVTTTTGGPRPAATAPAPAARSPGQPAPQPTAIVTPQPGASATPASGALPTPAASLPVAAPTPAPAAAGPEAAGSSNGWIALAVAIVAVLAAGWFLLGRRRRRAAEIEEEEVVAAAPAEPVAAPATPPAPTGHVTIPSRRIAALTEERGKPEIEIVLIPRRAGTNLLSAAVDYRVLVRNTGQGAARGVRFGIYMLSASARQAADLQSIFAAPIERPVVPPFDLAPGGEVELSGMALLPRENVNVMKSDGKTWFVPVLAMKAEYRWGENVGAPGVATAAHMIGINRGDGAKMAPFRLEDVHMHPQVAERRVA